MADIRANKVLAAAANRGIDALNARGQACPKILFAIANMGELSVGQLQNWRRSLTDAETAEDSVLFEALGGAVAKGFLRQFAPAKPKVASSEKKVKTNGPDNPPSA